MLTLPSTATLIQEAAESRTSSVFAPGVPDGEAAGEAEAAGDPEAEASGDAVESVTAEAATAGAVAVLEGSGPGAVLGAGAGVE